MMLNDKIANIMREAADAFQRRPQSMRHSAFMQCLTAFQTASNPANVLAILDERDELKARIVELERAAIRGIAIREPGK